MRAQRRQRSGDSSSNRAGLHFSIGHIDRLVKKHHPRVSVKDSVYLAAVIEYIATEVVELAGNDARERGETRIEPRHILNLLKNDGELGNLFLTSSPWHRYILGLLKKDGGRKKPAPPLSRSQSEEDEEELGKLFQSMAISVPHEELCDLVRDHLTFAL